LPSFASTTLLLNTRRTSTSAPSDYAIGQR
jgi:hypothetical protein